MAEPENKLGGHNLVQGRHDSMVVVWLPCELLVPCSIPNGDSFFFQNFRGAPLGTYWLHHGREQQIT